MNKKISALNNRKTNLMGKSRFVIRLLRETFSLLRGVSPIRRFGYSFVVFVSLLGVLGFGAQAQAADYYMATDGSDTIGDGSAENEWQTLQHSMAQMSGGDTLIIRDGIYTGTSNIISSSSYPPDGSDGNYTILKAENNGQVTFDGQGNNDMFQYNSNDPMQYIEFRGIGWANPSSSSAVQLGRGEYIKFIRCGAYGEIPGASSCWRIAHYDGNPSRYILLEECYAYGGGRYKFTNYRSDHIILRRCVARYDYVTNTAEPKGCFNAYGSDYVKFQNCISIDGDTSGSWADTSAILSSFMTANNGDGSANIEFTGCLALNNDMPFGSTCDDDYGDVDYSNSVGWDLDWMSSNALFRGVDINLNHCTFGNFSNASSLYFSGYGGINSMRNSIFTDISTQEVISASGGNRFETITYNCFYDCDSYDAGTDAIVNVDPIDGTSGNGIPALKYLPRIENSSDLDGATSDGGDIGATVMKKIGVSGTLWGEPGYNTTTDEDLWPWPNEDIIKANMRTYSHPQISSERGFCANGTGLYGGNITLTSYIWEYLGNSCPSDICDYGEDTTPPFRSNPQPTGNLSSGTTSTTISLDTDETAICKYSRIIGTNYDLMTLQLSSGQANTHTATVSNLEDGNSYTYYIRCQDELNNQNTDDFEISFSVATHTTYSISNFINLVTDWLKSESGLESDVNGDGVVNTRDLGIMMSNWSE